MPDEQQSDREKRVERFIRRYTDGKVWTRADAQREPEKLLDQAVRGDAAIVDGPHTVAVLSVDLLRQMLMEATGPENWAEFLPVKKRPPGVDDLELAPPRSLERAVFELDSDIPTRGDDE